MKPAQFDYCAPSEVDEVLAILVGAPEDTCLLAGGQSLVPMLNMRLSRPPLVVDLNRVASLRGTEIAGGMLRIGAMTRQRALELDPFAQQVPLLVEAIRHVAHVPIRTRGTVGGSLAHADPAAELPATVAALDGRLLLRSQRGGRSVAARDFFIGPLTTERDADELVEGVEIPLPAPRSGWSFHEVTRTHGAFALIGLAATITLRQDGLIEGLRLSIFGVGGTPYLPDWLGSVVTGEEPGEPLFAEIAARVRDSLHPADDQQASGQYRKDVAATLTRPLFASSYTGGNGGVTERRRISMTVNGRTVDGDVEPRQHLADFLRDQLALRGTHLGCEHGVCGACTVLFEGEPVRSCLLLAVQAADGVVTTVEGLADEGRLHPLQEAFRDRHALQCGFCTPGMLMSALALLNEDPDIDDNQSIREALSGNLCRCTGYQNIIEAVREAAACMRAGGGTT